jgi:hypothetical protein
MKAGSRKRAAKLLGALAAVAMLVAAVVSGASGDTVKAGNLEVSIDGGVSPKKLPKNTPAPITLKVKGSIGTTDGSHVPALKTVDLQFDKHGSIYTKGLPTCNPSKLQSTLTAKAKQSCGSSLVGTGRVSAEIALPEQAPFNASGPLLIFNGPPKGGSPTLVFHVHANVPAPTTFVTSGTIKKIHGKYGTEALINIPTIVGGQGSLTSFEATLHKTWTYKGQKKSLLLASCPTGVLYAHGDFKFSNGTTLSGNVTRPCTPGA